jgi:hypothetical protein
MELMKVHTIPHLLSEDVGQICLAGDIDNLQCFVLNPLANGVFTQLDMLGCLRCYIIQPFDAGTIVVV